MTDQDFEPFMSEFRRVASAFERYPQSIDALKTRADVYFNVLRKYPLRLVLAKADRWIETQSKMPKPAEWAGIIASIDQGQAAPEMFDAESREWLRAERQHWEDPPCGCAECQQASVADKPMRFVPKFDEQGREMKGLCFGRIVSRGEWLHGFPLMRWHLGRENVFTMFDRSIKTMPHASDAEASRRERQLIARRLIAKHQEEPIVERPRYGEDR